MGNDLKGLYVTHEFEIDRGNAPDEIGGQGKVAALSRFSIKHGALAKHSHGLVESLG